MKFSRNEWLVIVFNLVYIIGFAIYYANLKNYEFLIYIGVLALIGLVVLFTLRSSKLDAVALWALSIWGLLHMLGGGLRFNGHTLYATRLIELVNRGGDFYILKMDQVIHFYGFTVSALVVYELIVNHFNNAKQYPKLSVFIAWIGAMGLGALNEIIEFVAYVVISNTGVGDIYNTGLDLIFNMFGALFGALLARYMKN